jgi:hypothetical protein
MKVLHSQPLSWQSRAAPAEGFSRNWRTRVMGSPTGVHPVDLARLDPPIFGFGPSGPGPYQGEPLGVLLDGTDHVDDVLRETMVIGDEVVGWKYDHDRSRVERLNVVRREEGSGGRALVLGLNQYPANRGTVQGLVEIGLLAL